MSIRPSPGMTPSSTSGPDPGAGPRGGGAEQQWEPGNRGQDPGAVAAAPGPCARRWRGGDDTASKAVRQGRQQQGAARVRVLGLQLARREREPETFLRPCAVPPTTRAGVAERDRGRTVGSDGVRQLVAEAEADRTDVINDRPV